MKPTKRLFEAAVTHRRLLLLVLILGLGTVSVGVVQLEEASGIQEFDLGTEEEEKMETIETQFPTHGGDEVAQIIVREDNALEKETLVSTLELQQAIRNDEQIRPTLIEERPTVGLANLVARGVLEETQGVSDPTIAEQIETLEAMSEQQVSRAVEQIQTEERTASEASVFLPEDHEQDSTNASSTMVVVFQNQAGEYPASDAPQELVDSHVAIEDHATDQHTDAIVVGNGLVTEEEQRALGDTMSLVGPAALLLVLAVLVLAYRDLLDVLLGFAGIILVQLWTFGTLGWVGIDFNPVMLAVPVLLIGLSIDYCIHVFMRYREQRAGGESIEQAMRTGLAGVGMALIWVTVTTTMGFLSNLTSPIAPIRELGLIAAIGIVGSFVIFGLVIPLLKVELDQVLEGIGIDRSQTPIGAGDGIISRILSVGSRAARTAPVVVVVLTLLLTAGTAVAATNVSTTWGPEDNMAEERPAWTENLPEAVQPGEYEVRKHIRYANENYIRHGSEGEILVEGEITDPATLERLPAAKERAADQSVVVSLSDGEPRVSSPLATIREVANENESFAATVDRTDTDGNGIPDTDLGTVYDQLFEVAPDRAEQVLSREDGTYEAYRLSVSVDPGAEGTEPAEQLEPVADELRTDGVTVTVTGQPVLEGIIQQRLLETLLVSFVITFVAVALVLAVVFRLAAGSALLGIVTVLPVAAAVGWILATMHALSYPLSVLNVIVASLTIGIGIDYSIHVTERFRAEFDAGTTVGSAIATTIRGTGGALLGSTATTAAGFGVLALAIHPPLQQFGTITAIMIGYAFLASVLVLPSLLVLWARLVGAETVSEPAPTGGDAIEG